MASLFESAGDLLFRGGPIMYPLLLLSVVAIAIVIERAWFWLTVHGLHPAGRLDGLGRVLRAGDRKSCLAAVDDDRSPYGGVVRKLLEEGVSDAVAVEAVEDVRPRLERFMSILSTIVTAAPLMGILGTVLGIINSFQLLDPQATLSDPREVSVGIASALITTAFGLVIALTALFPYMIFRGQVERALARMESLIASAEQGLR